MTDLQSDLIIFSRGGTLFTISSDQADEAIEWRTPAILPHAPKAILGVVKVRGRMLTIIDPLALVAAERAGDTNRPAYILPLKGEEQLGLALDKVEGKVGNAEGDYEPPGGESAGARAIILLEVKELFSAAMKGEDRRRKRF